MTQLMNGKKGLIVGVANDHSIAWGIAQALAQQGAELTLTYQGEPMKKRVLPLAEKLSAAMTLNMDVTQPKTMDQAFAQLTKKWKKIDFVVHAVAFSDRNELRGRYLDTSLDNFLNTMHISVYSFTELCRRAAPLMKDGGACLTLTYLGAQKYVQNYNVMGVAKAALEASVRYLAFDLGAQNVRVNAISAGPIKTLAAAGIGDFNAMLNWAQLNAPLGKNVTPQDIGQTATFLLSDFSSSITGEVVYVDAGYHNQGMICLKNAGALAQVLQSAKK
ncbi:MAG: enoyl-ACP reductase [Alphaproteobacteria bacterium]|nr:enoyl-ACP reductase [Alphaproteobacteria bacterium]